MVCDLLSTIRMQSASSNQSVGQILLLITIITRDPATFAGSPRSLPADTVPMINTCLHNAHWTSVHWLVAAPDGCTCEGLTILFVHNSCKCRTSSSMNIPQPLLYDQAVTLEITPIEDTDYTLLPAQMHAFSFLFMFPCSGR